MHKTTFSANEGRLPQDTYSIKWRLTLCSKCLYSLKLVEKNEVQSTVLQNLFPTAFFLMKEFMANHKLIRLLNFMEKVLGMSQLKYFPTVHKDLLEKFS